MQSSRPPHAPQTRKLPFRLCEVLEKEFVAVHGRPCHAPSWLLEHEHVDAKLLDYLRKPSQADFPDAVGMLRARLVEVQPALESAGDQALLVEALNALLQNERSLFDHSLIDRHVDVWQLADVLAREP